MSETMIPSLPISVASPAHEIEKGRRRQKKIQTSILSDTALMSMAMMAMLQLEDAHLILAL